MPNSMRPLVLAVNASLTLKFEGSANVCGSTTQTVECATLMTNRIKEDEIGSIGKPVRNVHAFAFNKDSGGLLSKRTPSGMGVSQMPNSMRAARVCGDERIIPPCVKHLKDCLHCELDQLRPQSNVLHT